jgi:hypothetical protein
MMVFGSVEGGEESAAATCGGRREEKSFVHDD